MTISTRLIIATTAAAAAIAIAAGVTIAVQPATPDSAPSASATQTADPRAEPTPEAVTPVAISPDSATLSATDEMLLYMAEEEKLAMDVYDALGELWGSRIFTQISSSEATHQDRVLSLLDAAGLDDPRTGVAGTFTDDELQALYDDLIALGSTSPTAAFEVGVMIEERDIADLAQAIALADDASVVTVLDSLLAASQNHLSAFERQLS